MGIRRVERAIQPELPALFVRRGIRQIVGYLAIADRRIDKGIADIAFAIEQLVPEMGITLLVHKNAQLYLLSQAKHIGVADISPDTIGAGAGQIAPDAEQIF